MKFITLKMVEVFHRESLALFGGADSIRDRGLLESALARPENISAFERDASLFRLAAAVCAGIVKNHPFVDGNKRSGILAAEAFLALNGISLRYDEAMIVAMVMGLAAGEVSEAELEAWLSSMPRS